MDLELGSPVTTIESTENIYQNDTPQEKIDKFNINNINDANPWNYKILLLLRKIGKKTMGYRWMHEQDTKYYQKKSKNFNICERIILAFLGTLTGAGLATFLAQSNLDNNKVLYIVITIVQIITVFIAAFVKEYRNANNYEKHRNEHSSAAVKNAEINLEIQYQLALNIEDRDNDKQFLMNTIKKFNDVLYLAPKIRDETKEKYLENSEDNDMFNPIITNNDGILQIVVKDDDNKEKNSIEANRTNSKMKYQIDRWLTNF